MKPENDEVKRIKCSKDGDAVTLGVNETVSYEFFRHGSVGENMEFEIGDESVLRHLRTETEYLHPEKMKYPGWTGGDAPENDRSQGTGALDSVVDAGREGVGTAEPARPRDFETVRRAAGAGLISGV